MDYADFFNKAASSWFFAEPALYRTFCMHEIRENPEIDVAFRSGKKRIEYNPNLFGEMSAAAIKKLFKREVTRCALGHPYQRRPKLFDAEIAYRASNLVIDQPKDFLKNHSFLPKQSFEYYYYNLYFEEHGKIEDDEDESDGVPSSDGASSFDKAPGGMGGDAEDSESFGSSGVGGNAQSDSESNSESDSESNSENDGEENTNAGEGNSSGKGNGEGNAQSDSDGNSDNSENGNSDNGGEGNSDGSSDGEDNSESDSESNSDNGEGNGDGEGEGNGNSESGSASSDASEKNAANSATELWEFNAAAIEEARESAEVFGKILESSQNRSTLPYNISDLIEKKKERLPKHINILHLFKGSVTSALTHLTRMRPSRRSGFEQPGKKHEPLPRILCAIDTSGSVSSDMVEKMLAVVWGVFKTGIEKLDIITFDIKVNTERPIPYKARGNLKIVGRGGTDFQPPVDFFEKTRNYDGLIMMTDGYAPVPKLKFRGSRKKILWFIYGREILPQSDFYKIFSKTGFIAPFEFPRGMEKNEK